jgi:hypothetical protein
VRDRRAEQVREERLAPALVHAARARRCVQCKPTAADGQMPFEVLGACHHRQCPTTPCRTRRRSPAVGGRACELREPGRFASVVVSVMGESLSLLVVLRQKPSAARG